MTDAAAVEPPAGPPDDRWRAPPDVGAHGAVFRAQQFARLAQKELRESLRDRRTIVTLFVMPLLLYPVLSIAFQQVFLSSILGAKPDEYRLGFMSEANGAVFKDFLEQAAKDEVRDAAPKPAAALPKAAAALAESLTTATA
ncbi:MAG: hypothetical protein ACRDD1_16830, partial [Planctomycetia bacterium]